MKVGDPIEINFQECKTINESSISDEKYIVLYFWSLSCPFCHLSLKKFHEFRDSHSENIGIISIHRPMWPEDKDEAKLLRYISENHITEPCISDDDHSIGDKIGVDSWPAYVLMEDRHLRRRAAGEFGFSMIKAAVDRILS
jgi:thiol-disulfide isomerase/thioredoxin